jgi:hypothetical protein
MPAAITKAHLAEINIGFMSLVESELECRRMSRPAMTAEQYRNRHSLRRLLNFMMLRAAQGNRPPVSRRCTAGLRSTPPPRAELMRKSVVAALGEEQGARRVNSHYG